MTPDDLPADAASDVQPGVEADDRAIAPGESAVTRRSGAGALVLIGTPIGNLGDLTHRAEAELRQADAIACEDTRRTGRLLSHLAISAPPLIVVNDHTELDRVTVIIRRISEGERVALVTDAGMPAVSDPGERLVAAVVEAGLAVEVVPGPSAPLAALALSGLPTGRFVFEGFLPRKGSARRERLGEVAAERRTVILFEAPHRVVRTLRDLAEACGGERRVVLARELTKLHEEVWRGVLAAAVVHADEVAPRGEYVLVLEAVSASDIEPIDDAQLIDEVQRLCGDGSSTRDAVAEVARRHDVPKRRVYDLATRTPR